MFDGEASALVHRLSYFAFTGEETDGLLVYHRCNTKACVNPEHLRLGSALDQHRNQEAKRTAPRKNAKLTVEQVRSIFTDTRKVNDIAQSHHITRAMVIGIKKGKFWKWLRMGLKP